MSNSTKYRIGIFAYSLMAMGAISVNSAFSVIAEHFQVSDTEVALIASIPCIVIIVVTLFLGKVLEKVSQKKIGILGAILFLVGGLMPMVLDNLIVIFIFRAITGIGVAISQVFMATLTAEFFEEKDRPSVQGLAQAAQSAGLIIMCLVSGFLASVSWRASFLVHLLGAFSLIAMILCFPDRKPQAKEKSEQKSSARIGKNTIGWFALMFVVFLILLAFANNLSFLLIEKNIGSSADTGLALSVYAFAGLLVGLAYGKIDQYIKAMKLPLSMLLFAILFFIIVLAKSMLVVYIGSFIGGIALSLFFPQIMLYTGQSVDPLLVPVAISLLTCSQNLGQILCPYVINPLAGLLTKGGNLQTMKLIIAMVAFLILTVITGIYAIRRDRRDKQNMA